MKFAISNIAWERTEDNAVGALLKERAVAAVELAPTKYWPAPSNPSADELARVLEELADQPERLAAYGVAGRRFVAQFDQGKVLREFTDHLTALGAAAGTSEQAKCECEVAG